uniref:SSD domain-containing protein n=1 Tax=Steinernema glaseri TaxID=37863 RepID=A0A1I7Y0Z3_9BILA
MHEISESAARFAGQIFMLTPQLFLDFMGLDVVSGLKVRGIVTIVSLLFLGFLNLWIVHVTYKCLQCATEKNTETKLVFGTKNAENRV